MSMYWLLPVLIPLLVASMLMPPGRVRRLGMQLTPWAALPALILALLPDAGPFVSLPWLLLGTTLGLDQTSHVFLFLTAILWLAAGMYARRYLIGDPRRTQFLVFFLLAMAGNVGVILAQDIASFYLFFALLTFSAYPLIVHAGDRDAMRAGRIYLVMAVAAETLLFLALVLTATSAGTLSLEAAPSAVAASPVRDLIIALFLAGFAVKVGVIPLHVWLPLAHPVAPTPASAVLSGTIIVAGVLGWLRFLPLGEADLVGWGSLLVVMGLGSAFFGVAVGLTQLDCKTALAYSSISQMGLIAIAVGVGLADRDAWPAALIAVLILVLHHGLAKGALFLGVGVAAETTRAGLRRLLLLAGMALPALALVGAPFTSGAIAKLSLKEAATLMHPPLANWLAFLLPVAAVGTMLLMVRILAILPAADDGDRHGVHQAASRSAPSAGLLVPWLMLLVGVSLATFMIPARAGLLARAHPLDPAGLLSVVWPVIVGLLLAMVGWRVLRRPGRRVDPIPAGDILIPVEQLVERRTWWCVAAEPPTDQPDAATTSPRRELLRLGTAAERLHSLEARLTSWTMAGAVFIAVVLAMAITLVQP